MAPRLNTQGWDGEFWIETGPAAPPGGSAAASCGFMLASRMARGRLASPFTAREVYRNEWTGLTEPRVVGEALENLRELGWIRSEAVIARDGGRPAVRFHINPRVADR
jgi:hypothetical protein